MLYCSIPNGQKHKSISEPVAGDRRLYMSAWIRILHPSSKLLVSCRNIHALPWARAYLIDTTTLFDICRRSLAPAASVKYDCDSRDLVHVDSFAKVEMSVAVGLTNEAVSNPALGYHILICQVPPQLNCADNIMRIVPEADMKGK